MMMHAERLEADTPRLPVQITFRGLDPSAAIDHAVRAHAAKLERLHDRLTGCHVIVELPHRRQHQGKVYDVRIDLTLPGDEIAVSRDRSANHAHEDVYVAIRDAFDAARRQLEDHVRRERDSIKIAEGGR